MAATGYEPEVLIPAPLVREHGLLLTSAFRLPDSVFNVGGVNRMPLGVKFIPWGCDGLQVFPSDCDPLEKDLNALPEFVTQPAFSIVDGLFCTTLSGVEGDIDMRLMSRLRTRISYVFAKELIYGTQSGGESLAASATTVTSGPTNLLEALSLLEMKLATALQGEVGMIHVTPRAFTLLNALDAIKWMDNRWYTATGHVVVADAGYDTDLDPEGGSTPDGNEWMYGSGLVYFGVSDPELIGENDHTTFNRSKNRRERLAEAYGIVLFDPCSVFAAEYCYDTGCDVPAERG